MSATVAQVRLRAPEFASVSDDDVEEFLASAEAQVERALYPSSTVADLAVVMLASHELGCAQPALLVSGGPVTSESAGGLSRSYAVAAVATSDLGSTRFGREYERLVRTYGRRLTVA